MFCLEPRLLPTAFFVASEPLPATCIKLCQTVSTQHQYILRLFILYNEQGFTFVFFVWSTPVLRTLLPSAEGCCRDTLCIISGLQINLLWPPTIEDVS